MDALDDVRRHETGDELEKPLLLLDIDGVLNAFGVESPGPQHRVEMVGRYRVVLDQRHVMWLWQLDQVFDVVWATMWQGQAATVFAPALGYGEHWPHIEFDRHAADMRGRSGVGGYKLPGIRATVGDRPFVWVDDDADNPAIAAWVKRRDATIPSKVIVPDAAEGMTKAHYNELCRFAKEVRDAALSVGG